MRRTFDFETDKFAHDAVCRRVCTNGGLLERQL
jgi:hypothetical protein